MPNLDMTGPLGLGPGVGGRGKGRCRRLEKIREEVERLMEFTGAGAVTPSLPGAGARGRVLPPYDDRKKKNLMIRKPMGVGLINGRRSA